MTTFESNHQYLRCARNLVKNPLYPHWELCAVDDGSTDVNVYEILREYALKDSRIKIARHNQNQGLAAAGNTAISFATGEFCAFLDHDDIIADKALYEVACWINSKPDAKIIYSDEDKIDA